MEKDFKAYNNYVCPNCFNKLYECVCNIYPPYSLVFIDEPLQEHIRVLNNKGYRTIGCCEGHFNGVCICTYISFAVDYEFKSDNLPYGFKYDKKRRSIIFDYNKNISEKEMNNLKDFVIMNLLEWCKQLEERV